MTRPATMGPAMMPRPPRDAVEAGQQTVFVLGHQRHQNRVRERHYRTTTHHDERDGRSDEWTAGRDRRDDESESLGDQRKAWDADAAEPLAEFADGPG
jgi:hypothetical protein